MHRRGICYACQLNDAKYFVFQRVCAAISMDWFDLFGRCFRLLFAFTRHATHKRTKLLKLLVLIGTWRIYYTFHTFDSKYARPRLPDKSNDFRVFLHSYDFFVHLSFVCHTIRYHFSLHYLWWIVTVDVPILCNYHLECVLYVRTYIWVFTSFLPISTISFS